MAFNFEKLRVWQDAVDLSGEVNEIIKTFPKAEMYVLSSQMQRAADSIALNIGEGSTGQSKPEFSRFLGYSIRSGIEVVTALYLAKKRNLINDEQFNLHYNRIEELIKAIQALRKSLK